MKHSSLLQSQFEGCPAALLEEIADFVNKVETDSDEPIFYLLANNGMICAFYSDTEEEALAKANDRCNRKLAEADYFERNR